MKRYLIATIAAMAMVLGIAGVHESEAASSACPPYLGGPVATVFVGGSAGTAQALVTLDQSAPRTVSKGAFYVFDIADNGHRETVLFGSVRDAQLRSLFPGIVASCDVKYSVYRIDLTGAGHFETVTAGSVREAQLRALGYIN